MLAEHPVRNLTIDRPASVLGFVSQNCSFRRLTQDLFKIRVYVAFGIGKVRIRVIEVVGNVEGVTVRVQIKSKPDIGVLFNKISDSLSLWL